MRKEVAIGGKHGEAKSLFAFKAMIKRPLWHGDILDHRINTRRGRPPKVDRQFDDTRQALIRSGLEVLTETGYLAAGLQDGGGIGIHDLDRVV